MSFGSETTGGDIYVDPAGNILVGGNRYTAAAGCDYLIVKVAPDGTLIHAESFNDGANQLDKEGGFGLDSNGDSYLWGWLVGPSGTVEWHVAKYLTSH